MSAWFWIPNQQKAKGNPNHSPTDGKFTSGGGSGLSAQDQKDYAAYVAYAGDSHIWDKSDESKSRYAEHYRGMLARGEVKFKNTLEGQTQSYASELSPQDRKILTEYTTSDGYEIVNNVLRGTDNRKMVLQEIGPKERARAAEMTRVLDAAFKDKRNRLQKNMTLYRGIDDASLMDSLKVGSIMTDKGFVSTTRSQEVAQRFSQDEEEMSDTGGIFTIRVSKGHPAMGMENISEASDEQEVLLPRNSKFKVVSKRGNKVTLEALR